MFPLAAGTMGGLIRGGSLPSAIGALIPRPAPQYPHLFARRSLSRHPTLHLFAARSSQAIFLFIFYWKTNNI